MRYDIRSIVLLLGLIILALVIIRIIHGILSFLLPIAIIIIAAYIVYRIIKKH